jgi:hypothetical protein
MSNNEYILSRIELQMKIYDQYARELNRLMLCNMSSMFNYEINQLFAKMETILDICSDFCKELDLETLLINSI